MLLVDAIDFRNVNYFIIQFLCERALTKSLNINTDLILIIHNFLYLKVWSYKQKVGGLKQKHKISGSEK